MDFDEYQKLAAKTDQTDFGSGIDSELFHLLGIVDEAGSLITEYKKYMVDGDYYRIFKDRLEEELGDVLWYVANFATRTGLSLKDVAESNIKKANDRYGSQSAKGKFMPLDSGYPTTERLPIKFEARVEPYQSDDGRRVRLILNGMRCGDTLTDNSYKEDGYRFHDVFHLAYMTFLGWSPVMRKLLNTKRKSSPKIDEVEDGARARIIEEAISALVFNYAEAYDYFTKSGTVDNGLLRDISGLTSRLEVKRATPAEWENAILSGFEVWRQVVKNDGGVVLGDASTGLFEFRER